jgi:hypothetical protein
MSLIRRIQIDIRHAMVDDESEGNFGSVFPISSLVLQLLAFILKHFKK